MAIIFKHADRERIEAIQERLQQVILEVEALRRSNRRPSLEDIRILSVALGSIHNDFYIATHESDGKIDFVDSDQSQVDVLESEDSGQVIYSILGTRLAVEEKVKEIYQKYDLFKYGTVTTLYGYFEGMQRAVVKRWKSKQGE